MKSADIPLDRVNKFAQQLEVRPKKRESEQEFRARVAKAVVDSYDDPILAAEIFTGTDYHNFNQAENGLAFCLMHENARKKREWYSMVSDTYQSMPWQDFNNILIGNRFERVLCYDFSSKSGSGEIDEFAVWARKDRGFLLIAKSYNGKKVMDGANLHYELSLLIDGRELDELEDLIVWDSVLARASNGPCIDSKDRHVARDVDFDCREGLVEYIQKLEASPLQTNVPWKFFNEHNLWLLHPGESDSLNKSAKVIIQRKIQMLPKYVQVMIGFKP